GRFEQKSRDCRVERCRICPPPGTFRWLHRCSERRYDRTGRATNRTTSARAPAPSEEKSCENVPLPKVDVASQPQPCKRRTIFHFSVDAWPHSNHSGTNPCQPPTRANGCGAGRRPVGKRARHFIKIGAGGSWLMISSSAGSALLRVSPRE